MRGQIIEIFNRASLALSLKAFVFIMKPNMKKNRKGDNFLRGWFLQWVRALSRVSTLFALASLCKVGVASVYILHAVFLLLFSLFLRLNHVPHFISQYSWKAGA